MVYIKQSGMAKREWSPWTTKLSLESKTELYKYKGNDMNGWMSGMKTGLLSCSRNL